MIHRILIAISAAASFNVFLQFGLGLRNLFRSSDSVTPDPRRGAIIIALTGPIIFAFYNFLLTPLSLGFLNIFILYPFLALCCYGIDHFIFPRISIHIPLGDPLAITAYDGLAIGNAFFVLRLAPDFVSALVFSVAEAAGFWLTGCILAALLKRLENEHVPVILRGLPISLIAIGLLSLVCAYLASLSFALFRTAL